MIHLLPSIETTPGTSPRPLMFDIKDKNQLYTFYMPFLKFGGLFVPSQPGQPLMVPGSKALVLLQLLDDKAKKTVTGKICWQTPAHAQIGVSQGFGVAFDDNETNRLLKIQIENALAGMLGKSDTRTQTL